MTKFSDRQVGYRSMAGWLAVGLSAAMASFWAFWGSVECFHEGWYYTSIWKNLALMFAQYLSPMLVFILLAVVSIRSPRIGAAAHLLFGFFVSLIFHSVGIVLVFGVPLLAGAILYWFGQTDPKRWAWTLVIAFPLLTVVGASIGPAKTLFTRVDDGYRGARLVHGNGADLVWAPQGPGWTETGTDWFAAKSACDRLSVDGLRLHDSSVGVWRLPTLDELVRSSARHGANVGGVLDKATMKATYTLTPDKETPLWNRFSRIVYLWSSTERDSSNAWLYNFNGSVIPQNKRLRPDLVGFRAVREATPADSALIFEDPAPKR